jgi:hypothetical protein
MKGLLRKHDPAREGPLTPTLSPEGRGRLADLVRVIRIE